MSAILSKETKYGTSATFWRLRYAAIDRDEETLTVIISGYISEDAYNAGASPVESWTETYGKESLPFDLNNLQPGTPEYALFGAFYMLVMQDPFFTGATPV